jgi:hypothetical protein
LEKYNLSMINVTLERDADNTYNANAVKVMVNVNNGSRYHLGFIPRDLAALLAPLLDKGVELAARLKGITGGYETRETRGALITIEM